MELYKEEHNFYYIPLSNTLLPSFHASYTASLKILLILISPTPHYMLDVFSLQITCFFLSSHKKPIVVYHPLLKRPVALI